MQLIGELFCPLSLRLIVTNIPAIELIAKITLRIADPFEYFCGRTYTYAIDLEEHRRARGHFPSHVCRGSCRHPLVAQYDFTIRKCGYCGKLYKRLDIFKDHYIATRHYFCNARKAGKATTVSAGDHVYKICRRTFPSLQSFQQHCKSIKHKPISALSCPIGGGCKRKFSAPSALLHHLESGKCCSGMDRDDIYDIVQLYDKDHTIHTLPKLTPSSSTYLSLHGLSPGSGTPTASLDSPDGWLLVTPTHSQAFRTIQALQQHIVSPTHYNKVYHCPRNPLPINSSKAKTKQEKAKQFTTLSGLAQHLESGAYLGGRQTFLRCIELIQQHLGQCGLRGMSLLLPGSQD
ncbi:hypothetical protein COCMIDRAFT_41895 [Bipolaris oryzae ATCC 44560]|uniref:C2H2-type domain-containing protein n=1 Tax=Bipolaris oryzae ATCC 44560 TaxID=930090 RepID=W6YJQ8_COCMI|nr:uncharacterized protein COCMIDRAFT_41895 [Bipolaris oryzae ATCC 44560]EUC39607.1 hypothetical protein COCMIDRAFT_41895 [Bipolaris oryzae ATCC 44560]